MYSHVAAITNNENTLAELIEVSFLREKYNGNGLVDQAKADCPASDIGGIGETTGWIGMTPGVGKGTDVLGVNRGLYFAEEGKMEEIRIELSH